MNAIELHIGDKVQVSAHILEADDTIAAFLVDEAGVYMTGVVYRITDDLIGVRFGDEPIIRNSDLWWFKSHELELVQAPALGSAIRV